MLSNPTIRSSISKWQWHLPPLPQLPCPSLNICIRPSSQTFKISVCQSARFKLFLTPSSSSLITASVCDNLALEAHINSAVSFCSQPQILGDCSYTWLLPRRNARPTRHQARLPRRHPRFVTTIQDRPSSPSNPYPMEPPPPMTTVPLTILQDKNHSEQQELPCQQLSHCRNYENKERGA